MPYFSLMRMGNSETIFEGEFNSLQNCLEDAIRQNICLDYIDLRGANLINADLDEGSFNYARFDHANLTGAICSMSYPPIVIKGLEYKVVLFDDYMKVGSAVFDYNTWQKLRSHGEQTKLDQNIEGFIRLYGPFLFTLADIRTPMTKHLNVKREKNVA